MSYAVETVPRFDRLARRFFRRHPELHDRFTQLVADLQADPFQPHLRLHALTGELDGLFAVSLTHAYRGVLILQVTERLITLIAVGTHDELYR
jgi:mRNA-degrading endonuclease YafQ of YafQ-DinJ toxin-antitoxin module